jgi:hypothetical protein
MGLAQSQPELTRQFVADVAIVAEQLIMYDLPTDRTPGLSADASRERSAPFFPDRMAEIAEEPNSVNCKLRLQRAKWRSELVERRGMRVAEWVDTAQGTEKAAAVLVWDRGLGGAPTIVVAFRGSKSSNDWLRTNAAFASPRRRVVELSESVYQGVRPDGAAASPAEESSRPEREVSLQAAWVPLPLWLAYAGVNGRERNGSPRACVRQAVERLLCSMPRSTQLVVTGHSLGGALAQACALDLLLASTLVRARVPSLTLLPVASPAAFSPGFQSKIRQLSRDGRLRALHLTAAGDFAPMIAGSIFPRFLLGVHGVTQRLVLNTADLARPCYFVADGEDDDCEDLGRASLDSYGHNMYAKDLCGLTTPRRPRTLPFNVPWPVPSCV